MSLYEDKLTKGSTTPEDNLQKITGVGTDRLTAGSGSAEDNLQKITGVGTDRLTAGSGSAEDNLAKSAGSAEDNLAASNAAGQDGMESLNKQTEALSFISQPLDCGLTVTQEQAEEGVDGFEHYQPYNIYDFKFTSESYDFLTEEETLDFIRS